MRWLAVLLGAIVAQAQVTLPAYQGVFAAGPSPIKLVAFGDSITGNPSGCSVSGANTYPQILASLVQTRQSKPVQLTQVGLSGSSWNYTQGVLPTLSGYLPGSVGAAASATTKLVLFAGTNGLVLGGHTPAQEYSDFQGTLATLLAEGYVAANIVVVTMLPRQTYSETDRATYNSLLVGGASTHGYSMARVDVNTDIGAGGAQQIPTFFCDQIHPTGGATTYEAGHEQIARIIYDAMYPGYPWTISSPGVTPLWSYDAQNSASITQSGGTVSAWADQSGNGNTLTQPTGALQPTYNATGVNGHPGIQFPNSGVYLQTSLPSYEGNNITIAAVVQLDDVTNAQMMWTMAANTSVYNSGMDFSIGLLGPNRAALGDNVSGKTAKAIVADTSAHLISGQFGTGQSTSSAQVFNLFTDGTCYETTQFSNPCPSVYPGTPVSGYSVIGLRVGHIYQYGFWNLNGRLGEIRAYEGVMSAYDRQKLEAYLKAKWGTP